MQELLMALRAVAESTRLRIVAAVDHTELTVGELCRVLDQSQPRVSRHLKLLCDAGVLVRHAQGTSAFYRPSPSGTGSSIHGAVMALIDLNDPMHRRDAQRLAVVREDRAAEAESYFESIAADWNEMRELHVADDDVEKAMLEAVADVEIEALLDIGTGTGRVLEVFAPHIEQGIGVVGDQNALARLIIRPGRVVGAACGECREHEASLEFDERCRPYRQLVV